MSANYRGQYSHLFVESRDQEVAREQAERDFDAGEIGDLFGYLADDWSELVLQAVVEREGSSRVLWELLARANDAKLTQALFDARALAVRDMQESTTQ